MRVCFNFYYFYSRDRTPTLLKKIPRTTPIYVNINIIELITLVCLQHAHSIKISIHLAHIYFTRIATASTT